MTDLTQPETQVLVTAPMSAARTILCVTSSAASADDICDGLSHYCVVVAANGFEALRAINMCRFDVYLLDYWFSDWNGPALCRAIRKLDPHGPVLVFGDAARHMDKARALRAGAAAYFAKPLDFLALRSRIAALIARGDDESLKAKPEAQRTVREELDRRLKVAQATVDGAKRLAASSGERIARSKAMQAFFQAHGTAANFERWWPNVFASERANHTARVSSHAHPS